MKRWGRPRVRPAASHSPTRESQSKKTQKYEILKDKTHILKLSLVSLGHDYSSNNNNKNINPILTKNFPPVAGVHIVVVVTNRELVSERVTSRFFQG